MARFRRKGRFTRRMSSGFRRMTRRRSSGSSGENLLLTAAAAGVYGATRPMIESWISPITSQIPLGGYADEVALGTLGYFMAKGKLGNNKIVKSAGKAMLIIEAARVGSGVGSQMLGGTTASGSLY